MTTGEMRTTKQPSTSTYAVGDLSVEDVLTFLWRAKYFMIAGALISIGISTTYATLKLNQTYTSRISLRIDAANSPTFSEPEAITEQFNSAITSPSLAKTAYHELVRINETFAQKLKKQSFTGDEFVSRLAFVTKGEKMPITLQPSLSSNDMIARIILPAKGLGSDIGRAAENAINAVVDARNARVVNSWEFKAEKNVKSALDRLMIKQEQFAADFKNWGKEAIKIKTELLTIENKLLKKARAHDIQIPTPPLEPKTRIERIYGSRPDEELPPNRDFKKIDTSRILMIAGALRSNDKLEDSEIEKVYDDLASLQVRSIENEMAISRAKNTISSVLARLERAANQLSELDQPSERLLPNFKLNTSVHKYRSKHGAYEKPSNRSLYLVLFSTIAGILTGLLVAVIYRTLRD